MYYVCKVVPKNRTVLKGCSFIDNPYFVGAWIAVPQKGQRQTANLGLTAALYKFLISKIRIFAHNRRPQK